MEKVRITFFREMYYWQYFYTKKLKANGVPIRTFNGRLELGPFMQLRVFMMFNFLSLYIFLSYIFKMFNCDVIQVIIRNVDSTFIYVTLGVPLFILMMLDPFLIYKKRDEIFVICEQFSKKRRIIGQIKYWTYIALSILFFLGIYNFCMSGYNGNALNLKKDSISSVLKMDTIALYAEKENNSMLTLKVKIIEDMDGDKYIWEKAKVLSTFKNNSKVQIPDTLLISSYCWLEGDLQKGKTYIVYLLPYPLESDTIFDINKWILLDGDVSKGARLIE